MITLVDMKEKCCCIKEVLVLENSSGLPCYLTDENSFLSSGFLWAIRNYGITTVRESINHIQFDETVFLFKAYRDFTFIVSAFLTHNSTHHQGVIASLKGFLDSFSCKFYEKYEDKIETWKQIRENSCIDFKNEQKELEDQFYRDLSVYMHVCNWDGFNEFQLQFDEVSKILSKE